MLKRLAARVVRKREERLSFFQKGEKEEGWSLLGKGSAEGHTKGKKREKRTKERAGDSVIRGSSIVISVVCLVIHPSA